MKELLNDNTIRPLIKQIKHYSDRIVLPYQESAVSFHLSEEQAASVIQQTWRKKKIKDAMIKTPFHTYRSMVDINDAQRQLSTLMLGHHVAEQSYGAKEQIPNPLINTIEYYHRSTALDNPVLNVLFKEFGLENLDHEKYYYIPISLLKNNPIEDVLDLFSGQMPDLQLIKKQPYTIAVLVIPTLDEIPLNKLKDKIKNMGLVASSWEIAENIRTSVLEIPEQEHEKISLNTNLPKTREELLNSELMIKLKAISHKEKTYPTAHLAECLKKLLSDLPPNLSSSAIQRIATMVDFTNTFFLYHYPRYALCIYYILHEISLALIENTNPAYLEQEYVRFKEESSSTLENALSINKNNLSKSSFLATASTSGASACAVAMRIASNMIIKDDARPKVKIFKPCYYELPNTFNLDSTDNANEADVLMISAGPIVNPEGLTPGIDINLFVKHHVIDTARSKPVTLIIDATTALYKNLRLNVEVQELVAKGQLSIIIHESHQKFGLIHSDQAQYGRVFGWCSNEHFSKETLAEVEANSKADFFNHSDIRIGSFISTRCSNTLEQIKMRHFANGALLRKLLLGTSIISEHIEKNTDMQENLDELYFLTNQETKKGSYASNMEYAAYGAIEYRNGFGHFTLTSANADGLRRLSPDASDSLDNLVLASHMRLARQYNYSARKMLELLIKPAQTKEKLVLEEQIVLMGMIHNIASFFPIMPLNFNQIYYLDRPLKDEDKHKTFSSGKNSKNIIISKAIDSTYYLGFHSHGKVFRQVAIKDPKIIKIIESGTINTLESVSLVKDYLSSLQQQYLPPETNFPFIYAAMSTALKCCPLLESRPFIMDINYWLNTVKNKIIQEYKPENPDKFIQGIKILYTANSDSDSMKYGLIFLSNINLSSKTISPQIFQNKDFIKAIKKVHEGNQQILDNLKNSPNKYKLAELSSKHYLETCFHALHDFYSIHTPNASQRSTLIRSISNAEDDYLQVLSKDRNTLSQMARYILKAVTNFIAALTFGAAHYLNYKVTGNIFFFSGTTSEGKLKKLDKELIEDIPANILTN